MSYDTNEFPLPIAETPAALALAVGGYPGRPVWVQSLRRSFVLDPFSTATANGIDVIASSAGGKWVPAWQSDEAISRQAQGILAETTSRHTSTAASSALVTQSAYFSGIILRTGTVVTNITVSVTVAGAAVSLSKVGLYDSTGVQLAVSADQGTNWQSTGNKTIAMIAPYTVLTTGFYYVCALAVFTSTAPALLRASTGAGVVLANAAIGTGVVPFGIQLSQADMPSPATIVAGTQTALAVWGAIT